MVIINFDIKQQIFLAILIEPISQVLKKVTRGCWSLM